MSLPVVTELFIDGAWVDVTDADHVLTRDAITISRGAGDESSSPRPSKARLSLRNTDGRYSPRNPTSPYYGLLGRNTPLRIRVEDTFPTPTMANINTVSFNGGTSFAMAPPVDVVAGNLLIAFQSADAAVLADLLEPTGNGGDASWELLDSAYTDAANDLCTKIWWRVARDDEPASYNFFQASGSDGVVTIVSIENAGHATPIVAQTLESAPGTSVDTPTLTPATNNDFELRWVAMTDATGAANTWTPPAGFTERSDWQSTTFTTCSLATRPRTSGAAGGVHTFTASSAVFDSAHGFTVSVMPDAVRFSGEVSSWPSKWNEPGTDVWVPIEASGIMRRLGQGASPLRSALFRELSVNSDLTAYWPMEDAAGSLRFASGLPGGLPATIHRPPGAAADAITLAGSSTVDVGTAPLPVLANATVRGRVPNRTVTEWTIGALFYFDGEPDNSYLEWDCGGTLPVWLLSSSASTDDISLMALDADNVVRIDATFDPGTSLANRWIYVVCSATQNGSAIDYTFGYSDGTTNESLVGSVASQTIGAISQVYINPGNTTGCPVGHVFVSDVDLPFPGPGAAAMLGHAGETAVERITRLCDEEGIYLEVIGESATSEVVGVQRVAPLLDLVTDAASADQGILYEPRGRLGLAYRTRTSLYNQAAALALDYAAKEIAPPFEPVDDDQHVRNDITVKRLDGSQARAVRETGPLSVLAPPNGVGRYDEAVTLNVQLDDQLEQIASWRRHLGTWDEARYPTVSVIGPTAAAALVDIGGLLTADNPPAWLPPGLIELLARGYMETLGDTIWKLTWNASPAGPYRVFVVEGSGNLGRLDTAGCTLAEDLTTTETLIDVTTPVGPVWGTRDLPYDVGVGGEQMTITAVSGAGSNQTLTATRSVNGVVKTHDTDAPVSLWKPPVWAL